HWETYKCVMDRATRERVPFALGGGLSVSVYTGKPRYTKDLDLYIMPQHKPWVVNVMTNCGLQDYFDANPYDRAWIYRGNKDEIIVDAIWAMANKRAQVDSGWLRDGPMV